MTPTPKPSPLESQQMAGAAVSMAGLGPSDGAGPGVGPGGGSIPLATLIDFIIQRTYHDLTVLAELLPRKTDAERKIEVFQFAARTRQLFVRLLALVKWAASVSKVDKSSSIMAFLDKQSMIFVETADSLSRMARETLVHARLPNFHLPAAVEVMTTGTYSRMPTCIRDRIIPPDPITVAEKKSTLQRLSQVIEYRLATSSLPPQMRKMRIENGRVRFIVDHEFEAQLTLMGDGAATPWRLLDINILVEDKETGDGRQLVHPLQVRYVHQLLQTRLVDCTNPLTELYMVLHTFCQSLQLEVLHSQTMRLCQERLGDLIRVEEYATGRSLTVSYWKEMALRDLKSDLGYRLTVHASAHDSSKPLQVAHNPPLSSKDSELAEQSIRSDQLSLEKLLVHTIYMRTRSRLNELKQELQPRIGSDVDCVVQGSPAVLHLPILSPCLRSEQLLITVDTHTGNLQAHIPQDDPPATLMNELQQTLNGDKSRFEAMVGELRFWITQRRCHKTLQHLPVSIYEKLPLLYDAECRLSKLDRHKLFLRLHKHPNALLVIEFRDRTSRFDMDFVCYLVNVRPASIHETPPASDAEAAPPTSDLPKMYLKVTSVVELNSFVLTHGPHTAVGALNADSGTSAGVSGGSSASGNAPGQKRKLYPLTKNSDAAGATPALATPGPSKRAKHPAYQLPDLSHIVALCDERIPFAALAAQLTRRNILYHGPSVEAQGTALALKLVALPSVDGVARPLMAALQRRLLAATVRMQVKGSRAWIVELVFNGSPLPTTWPTEQGPRLPVFLTYEVTSDDDMGRTVDAILQDWTHIATLYAATVSLASLLKQDRSSGHSSAISVKTYNYKKVAFSYGPARSATATVTWRAADKKFNLALSSSGQLGSNPHSSMRDQLELFLNQQKSVGYLARVLHETYEPLASLIKLPNTPHLGILTAKPTTAVQTFTPMAHSATHIRLAFFNLYCLDVRMRADGLVSIRDGAFSLFDKSKVIEEFFPTQGLKAFLSKYVDETAVSRRRSQSEDDNPPSPISTFEADASSHFLGHGGAKTVASPGQGGAGSLRFHAPLTPSGSSNPHTPASPHMANITQQQQHGGAYGSSPATSTFSLASPPSLPAGVVNPSPSMLPHPSPGPGSAFGVASSPLNPLHAPSPAGMLPTPSPNPAAMGAGGIDTNSPFPASSLASPAPNAWPGSPGMPRPSPARPGGVSASHLSPHGAVHADAAAKAAAAAAPTPSMSRVLPQRSWAGAVPTLLTHEAFDVLCTPAALPGDISDSSSAGGCSAMVSPLERFLSCVYMKRHFQRIVQTEECLTALPSAEPGAIVFRCETMQGRVTVNPLHMQSLQLTVNAIPEYHQWGQDDLQALERFFEWRVAAVPFKPNALQAFGRLLNAPFRILRDLVQIVKLELVAAFAQQHPGLKWSVQLCLTVPPSAPAFVPVGSAAFLTARNKMLFFLHLRRLGMPADADGASVVLPLVYDVSTNVTQVAERREANGGGPVAQSASMMLKRYAEYNAMQGLPVQQQECSIWPCIRDVLVNLTLPNEPPLMNTQQPVNVPMGMASGGPQPQQQVAMGPGTPGLMQMQPGPMGVAMQVTTPTGAVNMPMQSPMAVGYGPVVGPMAMNAGQIMGGPMANMTNMGQPGPGGMM